MCLHPTILSHVCNATMYAINFLQYLQCTDVNGKQRQLCIDFTSSLVTLQAPQANGKAVVIKDEEQAAQRLLKQAEQVWCMSLYVLLRCSHISQYVALVAAALRYAPQRHHLV